MPLPNHTVAGALEALDLVEGGLELGCRSACGEQLLQEADTRENASAFPHVSRSIRLELRQVIAVSPFRNGVAAADRPQSGARKCTGLTRRQARHRPPSGTRCERGEGAAVRCVDTLSLDCFRSDPGPTAVHDGAGGEESGEQHVKHVGEPGGPRYRGSDGVLTRR
jgi:hypothetical protein